MKVIMPSWIRDHIELRLHDIASEQWELYGKINNIKVHLNNQQMSHLIWEIASSMGDFTDKRTRAGKWYKKHIGTQKIIKTIKIYETDFGSVELIS